MSTCRRMWTDRQIRYMADQSAKTRIEAGLTENAKPIYCHPIHINNSGDSQNNCHLTALIFNNDPTPFTKTTFKKWIDDLYASLPEGDEVQLLMSGGIFTSNKSKIIVASYLFMNGTNYGVAGVDVTGVLDAIYTSSLDGVFGASWSIKDSVNKIN